MQTPTIREIISRLESEGFVKVRQNGSHKRYKKGKFKVTISGKLSDHPLPKTYQRIKEQAGW